MKIEVKKISDVMNEATGFTIWKEKVEVNREKAYKSEHSIIRAVLFEIKMYEIPTFCSVHFARHSCTGQLHYVSSCREDRGYQGIANRNTPVNHLMLLNAQHLIDISRKRLCSKSHTKTSEIWYKISHKIEEIEPELSKYLVPNCVYRGYCPEFKTCGYYKRITSNSFI